MTDTNIHKLSERLDAILGRISILESTLPQGTEAPPSDDEPLPPQDHGPITHRLDQELTSKGVGLRCFVRCPPDYYQQPLEFRQSCLQAHSTNHLCKTIIMQNTRIDQPLPGTHLTDVSNGKYYMVLVQYAARLNAEKLRNIVKKHTNGKLSKKMINVRLVAEEISDELSGFGHNSVTPVGIKTRLPIIMSHRIAALVPDFFWLGAGEVDLKVGMSAGEFIEAYKPIVADCTYDDDGDAE